MCVRHRVLRAVALDEEPTVAGDSAEALLNLLGPQAFEHRGIARRLILRRPDEVAAEAAKKR